MKKVDVSELMDILRRFNGRKYSLYGKLRNVHVVSDRGTYRLIKVQGDPHAQPSIVEVILPYPRHGFPKKFLSGKNTIPFTDYITRKLHQICIRNSRKCGSGNSCYIGIPKPSPRILPRSSVEVNEKLDIILRFYVGLPAKGRRILGREAINVLCKKVPAIAKSVILLRENIEAIEGHVRNFLDQEFLREWIEKRNYMFFIGNGSILPRESSISEKPMKNSVPFKSPETLEVEVQLPSGKRVKGLAVKRGILVITGGGYHGKTTLLKAVQEGIYDHIVGDGREYVVSRKNTVYVKSEDGRIINNVDISSFISNLPTAEDTMNFSSLNASGSTSMAASIIEALEIGADVILFDEDTSATNLLYKDSLMAEIVKKEPIRPLINQLRDIVRKTNTGFVGVVSASSAPLAVADNVILMENYVPKDITENVRESLKGIVKELSFKGVRQRVFAGIRGFKKAKAKDYKIIVHYSDNLKFEIDLRNNLRIVEKGQVKTIAHLINLIAKENIHGKVADIVHYVHEVLSKGFSNVAKPTPPDLTFVNGFDVVWVLNRLYRARFRY